MFDTQPTNPQIVANLLNLADGWKELLGPDETKPRKARKPAAKRATRAKS